MGSLPPRLSAAASASPKSRKPSSATSVSSPLASLKWCDGAAGGTPTRRGPPRVGAREARHAALHDSPLRRSDELTAQVAVMIGLSGRLLRLAPARFNLDTVQIES